MIVTDKQYHLESVKIKVLNLLCKRVSGSNRFQNVWINDGKEGDGKSTICAADAYYMAYTLRRKMTLFFDIEALNEYAKNAKDEILIWDDAALEGLTLESYNQRILELIKIIMLGRKNRNTYFINIQDVLRLKEPLVQRAEGMNRVYSPDKISLGYYSYYNDIQIKWMYDQWSRKKKRVYKYYSFVGRFPNILYDIFDEVEYNKLKDRAIQSIGKKKVKREHPQVLEHNKRMRLAITKLDMSLKEKAQITGIPRPTLSEWRAEFRDVLENKGDGSVLGTDGRESINDVVNYIRPKDESYLALPPIKIVDPVSDPIAKQKALEVSLAY